MMLRNFPLELKQWKVDFAFRCFEHEQACAPAVISKLDVELPDVREPLVWYQGKHVRNNLSRIQSSYLV
jgi:hypothetical protein